MITCPQCGARNFKAEAAAPVQSPTRAEVLLEAAELAESDESLNGRGIAALLRQRAREAGAAPRVSGDELLAALEQGAREARANEYYRRWGHDDPKLVAAGERKNGAGRG